MATDANAGLAVEMQRKLAGPANGGSRRFDQSLA
jgi:hypothetical protein